MKLNQRKAAVLLLQDGTLFTGKCAGAEGIAIGELAFNTGMTGYQEVFTDPSYYGQLLIETNVHIGNYGVSMADTESDGIKIAGLICRSFHNYYSRHSASDDVVDYFVKNKVVAISDIDTRAVVRHIRHAGAMNAIVSSNGESLEELKELLSKAPGMEGLELSSKVSTTQPYFFGNEKSKLRCAVIDLGVKTNTLRNLAARDCYVQVFPHHTPFAQMEEWKPNGYLISNGPGDPATLTQVVATVKTIVYNKKPLFGICLGHQVLAQSQGIATYKMFNGHRGINHPVKNLVTGKCEITSQNHGFSVDAKSLLNHATVEVTHINLNDNTIEGIRLKKAPAFSVQYHPEAAPGPHDSNYLFDDFVRSMVN